MTTNPRTEPVFEINPSVNVVLDEDAKLTRIVGYTDFVQEYAMPCEDISKAQQVFPAEVVGSLLPEAEQIPSEFWDRSNKYNRLASRLFFGQVDGLVFDKPGVDNHVAGTHIMTCLGSYEPKHEHKEAGVAYLLYLWKAREVELEGSDEPETAGS